MVNKGVYRYPSPWISKACEKAEQITIAK